MFLSCKAFFSTLKHSLQHTSTSTHNTPHNTTPPHTSLHTPWTRHAPHTHHAVLHATLCWYMRDTTTSPSAGPGPLHSKCHAVCRGLRRRVCLMRTCHQKRELAKAHALWSLLRYVAVALRCVAGWCCCCSCFAGLLAACFSDCVRCSWSCTRGFVCVVFKGVFMWCFWQKCSWGSVCVVGATVVVLMAS